MRGSSAASKRQAPPGGRAMDREAREFWKQQRRNALRRDRGIYRRGSNDTPLTMLMIALMAASWMLGFVVPGWPGLIFDLPGGSVWALLLSAVLPGGLLSLLFAAWFVWVVGTQVESVCQPWQYLLIFFGAGAIGALAAGAVGGFGVESSLAAFGLAGAYVRIMSRFAGTGPSVQWMLILLAVNVVLSGFQPIVLAGMGGAFVAGMGIATVTGVVGR